MKITTPFIFFVIIACSLTLKSVDYQPHYFGKQHDPSYLFCAPIQFSQNGMEYYLKTIFNDKSYVQDFLPYSFTHLIQFLEYGKDSGFMEHALRLFCNKIKAAHYISASAFSDMLDKAPLLIKRHALREYDIIHFDYIKDSVKNSLYDMFLTKFTLFKQEPELFLDNLSHNLMEKVEKIYSIDDRIAQERLIQMLVRFLDIGTLKLMWNPRDQMQVWESVKKISNQFGSILKEDILSHEDLDDLLRSLTERFCYFLDLTGSGLSIDVIKKIKEEIIDGELLLFSFEEQEGYIETRAERMMQSVLQTEAKIEAKKFGMITDIMVYDK